MPNLTPIPERSWIREKLYKRFIQPRANKLLRLSYLPMYNVEPEHFLRYGSFEVELMVGCLQEGAWLMDEDWRPFVRYTIAKQLKSHSGDLFAPPFDEIRDNLLEYQLYGGKFSAQEHLKSFVRRLLGIQDLPDQSVAMCKLVLSILDELSINSLVQPFHWIRVAYAFTDPAPTFGMTLWNNEMREQKVTLCRMLRASRK